MDATFQKAMEFKKSGESVPWSLPNAALSGEITPTGTFRLANGSFCRRFVQKVKLADGHRTYYGMAVRNSDGVWVIPRR
jgi:surface antigen